MKMILAIFLASVLSVFATNQAVMYDPLTGQIFAYNTSFTNSWIGTATNGTNNMSGSLIVERNMIIGSWLGTNTIISASSTGSIIAVGGNSTTAPTGNYAIVNSSGSSIMGWENYGGTFEITNNSHGSMIRGRWNGGNSRFTISGASGATIAGNFANGNAFITNRTSHGGEQRLLLSGGGSVTLLNASGSSQFGALNAPDQVVSNDGAKGSIQLFNITAAGGAGNSNLMTSAAHASILAGTGVASDPYSATFGTNMNSHGAGSVSSMAGWIRDTSTVGRIVQTGGAWDDLLNPANSLFSFGTTDIAANNVSNAWVYATTATTNLTQDHLWAVIQVPHAWKTNTDLHPHIHFIQNNADQTNMWLLRYKWYNIGDIVPTNWTVLEASSNAATYSSGMMQQVADFSTDMVATGRTVSSLIDIKIYRRGAVGTGPIQFKQFDIHYQKDSLGSDQEFTKTF